MYFLAKEEDFLPQLSPFKSSREEYSPTNSEVLTRLEIQFSFGFANFKNNCSFVINQKFLRK
jgi:hypothetical protein